MTKLSFVPGILAIFALSACELSQDAATKSGFRTPSAGGVLTAGIDADGNRRQGRLVDSDGDGFAYVSGNDGDDGFAAYAGIIPGTDVGSALPGGTATYDATYTAAQIVDINLTQTSSTEGFLTGRSTIASGDITLTADIGDGTLTGTSTDGVLSVNGSIGSGTDLSGRVSYLGVSGALQGDVGTDKVVGVFHGNNAETIFAGGFLGTNTAGTD